MEIDYILQVSTRKGLRNWLEKNCEIVDHCWVLTTRGQKLEKTIYYLDAVEEAMCFGWIDSTIKKVSETQLAQRLSPRQKKSQWSELNKERVRRLEYLNKMTDCGRKYLPDMSDNGFKIDPYILKKIKEDEEIYENFKNFPDIYKKVRLDTIQIKKKSK
ncbi:hypothetical protein SAMN02745245_00367 [Anaerosphaera aminiphila DSM 21120]|uniref:Thymidylate synthase n=1 Tax=Anaerosphaera aminiphila DSM 21120 TaxID=1120995 RepID=A0A1M5PKP4_9FIRM|nr:hypothetical protein [Anaerosphaera aminiphila]SHH02270.1 hypothetical protein SAMN02745245_00367 [Anaerosphaera aminiphila DSM 21120]